MAITRIGGANAITGTIPTSVGGTGSTATTLPASLINNTSIGNVTALPASITTGKVLQVVYSQNNYQKSSSSTSYQDIESASGTVWETAITPSSTSSKILCSMNISWYIEMGGTANDMRATFRLQKKIGSGSYGAELSTPYTGLYFYTAQREDLSNWQQCFEQLLTLNTTSEVKFKADYKSMNTTNNNLVINYGCRSTCTLMEVAG